MLLKSINHIYYYINLKLFVSILAFFFNKLIPKWVWLLSNAFEYWTQHKHDKCLKLATYWTYVPFNTPIH